MRFAVATFVLFLSGTGILLADPPKSGIEVFKVPGSDFSQAERWIDRTTGVVCYAVGLQQPNSVGTSISCVKIAK